MKCIILILVFYSMSLSGQNWEINLLKDVNINRNKSLDPFYSDLSKATYPVNAGVPIIVISVGWLRKDKDMRNKGLYMAGSTLTALLAANIIKPIVKRPRPYITWPVLDNVEFENTSSLPSSHASTSFALAMSASLSYPKWYVIAPSFMYAGAVSYSRMHLGVHYPGDILAGIAVGCGSAWLNHWLSKKWLEKEKNSGTSREDQTYLMLSE